MANKIGTNLVLPLDDTCKAGCVSTNESEGKIR